MSIDINPCLSVINTLKRHINACYSKCKAKGSTYSGTENLTNLETAIDLIPNGGGGGGVSSNFSGFTVTTPDDPSTEQFTIDFGGVGVNWNSIVCYSDTKDGHFSINKTSNDKCIISSAVFYNSESEWDEATGIFPRARGTYRATYSISGNSITFTNAEYEATSNGMNTYEEFTSLPMQISNDVNDYFIDQYKLDKIIVCV